MTKTPVFQGPSGRKPGLRGPFMMSTGRKDATFHTKTGDYVGPDPHGQAADSVLLSVPPPLGAKEKIESNKVISSIDSRLYSQQVDRDLQRLASSHVLDGSIFESQFVADKLREWGHDPRTVMRESVGRRIRLARKLLRQVHQLRAKQNACPFPEPSGPARNIPSLHADALRRWAGGPMVLERPQGSSMHHLVAFHREYYPEKALSFDGFEDFVVEHDWHVAFADKSRDFLGGEWRLPYDECAFEFRISNVRVIAFLQQHADHISCDCTAMGIHREWHVMPMKFNIHDGDLVEPLLDPGDRYERLWCRPFDFIIKQVRAVCIMLDARVAEAETRVAPRELREHRQKMGRTSQNDYRVVSLVRRTTRPHSPGRAGQDGPAHHVKFHWRRGHWRHISTRGGQVPYIDAEGITRSKTWINWMPVGDPDLGFVEKEYRL